MARKRKKNKNIKIKYTEKKLSFQEAYLKLFKVAKSIEDINQYQGFLNFIKLFKSSYKEDLKYNNLNLDDIKQQVYNKIK